MAIVNGNNVLFGIKHTIVEGPSTLSSDHANVIKGTKSDTVVTIDDVSPITSKVKVQLIGSKNIFPETSITITEEEAVTYREVHVDYEIGKVYHLSCDFEQSGTSMVRVMLGPGFDWVDGTGTSGKLNLQFVAHPNIGMVEFRFYANANCVFSNIQLEEIGTLGQSEPYKEPTPYSPYLADGTAVTVKSCGKNLFDPDVLLQASGWVKDGEIYKGSISYIYSVFKKTGLPLLDGVFLNLKQYTFSVDIAQDADDGVDTIGFYFLYTDGTSSTVWYANKKNKTRYTVTSDLTKTVKGIHATYATGSNAKISNICCYEGTETEYEPYIEGESISTTVGESCELISIAPNMTITTDKGALISAEYNKDTNKVVDKLTKDVSNTQADIVDMQGKLETLKWAIFDLGGIVQW